MRRGEERIPDTQNRHTNGSGGVLRPDETGLRAGHEVFRSFASQLFNVATVEK